MRNIILTVTSAVTIPMLVVQGIYLWMVPENLTPEQWDGVWISEVVAFSFLMVAVSLKLIPENPRYDDRYGYSNDFYY